MNNKGRKIYIRKDLVGVDELSELDFELQDSFGYDYENDEIYIIDSIKNDSIRKKVRYYVDTTPLKISDLEKLLKKYKKKGATHIAIEHHTDHNGYEFSGFNVELADDEIIQRYEDELSKKLELNKKYNKLKLEIDKVRHEYDKLKV